MHTSYLSPWTPCDWPCWLCRQRGSTSAWSGPPHQLHTGRCVVPHVASDCRLACDVSWSVSQPRSGLAPCWRSRRSACCCSSVGTHSHTCTRRRLSPPGGKNMSYQIDSLEIMTGTCKNRWAFWPKYDPFRSYSNRQKKRQKNKNKRKQVPTYFGVVIKELQIDLLSSSCNYNENFRAFRYAHCTINYLALLYSLS